jgi:hypothetical protein
MPTDHHPPGKGGEIQWYLSVKMRLNICSNRRVESRGNKIVSARFTPCKKKAMRERGKRPRLIFIDIFRIKSEFLPHIIHYFS